MQELPQDQNATEGNAVYKSGQYGKVTISSRQSKGEKAKNGDSQNDKACPAKA